MVEVTLTNNLSSVDLQIHFYFEDTDVHAMNAEIFNNCQRHFINALKKANKFLNEELLIEVTAREKGGLIDNIKIFFENPVVLIITTALVTSFFSARFHPKLSITEETKNKIENIAAIKAAIDSGTITECEFEYITHHDSDLKKLKSNFFKSAKKDNTLTKIEIETTTEVNDKPIFNKIIVPYNMFDDFIVEIVEDDEKEIKDIQENDKARIFLIAPVLVKGIHARWKGYYGGIPIDFTVHDKDFLEQIYSQDIKFGNGTYIDCKLIIEIITKGETDKPVMNYEVVYVDKLDDDKNFIIPIKHRKKEDASQRLLFSEDRSE